MSLKPSMEEVEAAIATAGSIRKAAGPLGVDERTVRRWLADVTVNGDCPEVIKSPMRILGIDIETRPNLGYVWDLWNQNISLAALKESTYMLCFAAKWIGEDDETVFASEFEHGRQKMVSRAWSLMNTADVVVHYNGKRFDVPHLNREFVQMRLDPPAPFKQIDLLRTVKDNFKFPSNKLAYVAPALGLEEKVGHEGYGLWFKCMEGDGEAWGRMAEYNRQDVELLEQLYFHLRPWIKGHPSHSAMLGRDVCPTCGSNDLKPAGLAYLRTGQYPRWKCGDCGRYSRNTKRSGFTTITDLAS